VYIVILGKAGRHFRKVGHQHVSPDALFDPGELPAQAGAEGRKCGPVPGLLAQSSATPWPARQNTKGFSPYQATRIRDDASTLG
jgi:hypothetical protein